MAINDYLRTSSINVEGNLNFRKLEDKRRYNKWILGQGSRAEMGHEEVATNPTSRPPSWTQTDAKLDHAFVILPISGSSHELSTLNTYRSGSENLESTPVPVSLNTFYSKRTRQNYVQYKVSASSGLGNGTFVAASGSLFTGSTGGIQGRVLINVAEYGKLENIRVWVELAHQGSTETGSLDDLKICLRSPNVTNFFGIPWGNDPKIQYAYPKNMAAGGIFGWGEFQNAYVLWYGRTLFSQEEDADAICWGRDGNIRTIFWDGSPQKNPRNWGVLFASGTDSFQQYLIGYGSPSHTRTGVAYHTGSQTSWMSDVRLSKGRWLGLAAGSPPAGWLTGPGGVAANNEFATTGSNWGPETIQPVYPLLDDVYEIAFVTGSDGKEKRKFSGFRPGLRGTEINGTWELVFSNFEADDDPIYFRNFRLELWYSTNQNMGGHRGKIQSFAEKKYGSVPGRPGKLTEIAILSGGFNPWSTIAGQDIYHRTHLTKVYIKNPLCYQRTVGITDSTSSFSDFAVFTRITGTLADRLTGSAHAHLRYLFLNNQFGTPFISIASGSGEDTSGESFSDVSSNNRLISEIFRPLAKIGSSYTMKTSLSSKNTTQKTRDIALEKVTGSL